MSRPKNKYDLIQYTVRLNLNYPEHLKVHKILQNLNRDVHKSKNAFIVESIIRNSNNYSDEEMMTQAAVEKKRREEFITREEFKIMKEQMRTEILQEMTSLLISSLVKGNDNVLINNSNVEMKQPEADKEEEIDETLKELSASWA